MDFKPGMLLAFKWDANSYGICKVAGITETSKEPIIGIVTYSNCYESVPENLDPSELKPMVIHMPMYLPAMQASDCEEIGTAEVTEDEAKGYDNWLTAWKDRRTGFYERDIPSSIDYIIEQMAQVDNASSEDSMFRDRLMQRFQGMNR